MDNVLEFSSLAFAAMPYRFIYLGVDRYEIAFTIFAVKYGYKVVAYFVPLKWNLKRVCKKNKVAPINK